MLPQPTPFPCFCVLQSFHGFLLRYALVYVLVILLFPVRTLTQDPNKTRNITIPIDSPQIIYTPFLCNQTTTSATPGQCLGGWQTTREQEQTRISSMGPDAATGEVIPQIFFQFRGSALYLFTSDSSTALANITVTTNGTTISAVFNSNLGSASILNLVASTVTTFALTFLPNTATNSTQKFELTSMVASVPDGILTTTLPFLPSMTLPPLSSPPIFTPGSTSTLLLSSMSSSSRRSSRTASSTPTSSPSSSSAQRSNIALAVGTTVGLGLGLTSITAVGIWWYKKRRSRRMGWDNQQFPNQTNSPLGRPGENITFGGGGSSWWADAHHTGGPRFVRTGNAAFLGSGDDPRLGSVTPGWRTG